MLEFTSGREVRSIGVVDGVRGREVVFGNEGDEGEEIFVCNARFAS